MVKKKTKSKKSPKAKMIPSRLSWQGALKLLNSRIFKIRTPRGHGTGFHVGNFGVSNGLCAVATAFHVIEEAEDWDEPIKLVHHETGKTILLKEQGGIKRVIFTYPDSDLAIIVFGLPENFVITNDQLRHLPSDSSLLPGVDVAWCGFPGLMSNKLCFFHGFISCYINSDKGYLVDGVAINGVSGGPVFYIDNKTNSPVIAGVITAYVANRTSRDTLPGVSMIASVSPYEKTIKYLETLADANKEANKQKQEQEQKKSESKDEFKKPLSEEGQNIN